MSLQILHLNGADYELAPRDGGSTRADSDFRNGMQSGGQFTVDVMVEHDRQGRMVINPANVHAWLIYSVGSRGAYKPLPLNR